jgi:hypothetical protein
MTGVIVEIIEETTSAAAMVSAPVILHRLRKLHRQAGWLIDLRAVTGIESRPNLSSLLHVPAWTYHTSTVLTRRADDTDNHYRGDDRRGPQRRRQDDGGPRRRYEEPPFPKLRRLLLNIASSTKLPQDEAIEIAKYLGEQYDDERLRSDFFDVFVQL